MLFASLMSKEWMFVASSHPEFLQNHHQSFAGSARTRVSFDEYTCAQEEVMCSTSKETSSLSILIVIIVVNPRPALSALAENYLHISLVMGWEIRPSSLIS